MKSYFLPLAFVVLTVVQLQAKPQETLTGRVIGVHDGDTITVLDGSRTQHKVRLHGIDAPEEHQAFGAMSKQALSDIVFREDVSVKIQEKDRYGRTVGDVFKGTNWVNLAMVEIGMAWHYKAFSKSPELAEAQENAQDKKLGLWRDKSPVPPWEYRKESKKK